MRFDRLRLNRTEAKVAAAPAWTVTYADFVTVLLCIFVAMLSMSSIKQEGFEAALGSLQQTFGATAPVEAAEVQDHSLYGLLRPLVERQAGTGSTLEPVDSESTWTSIARIPGGAKLVFSGPLVFERGQNEIAQNAQDVLIQLAELTRGFDYTVVVRGHAAAEVPSGEQSLRDLSYERARNAARVLEQAGLAAEKISVVARGDGVPRFEHAYTEKRRAMNRRVEIDIIEAPVSDGTPQMSTEKKG